MKSAVPARILVVIAVSLCALGGMGTSFAAQNIIVAPCPWVPEDEKTANGTLADGISFVNVPPSGEIRIYTITGDLVRRIEFSGNMTGRERWDGRNDDGQDAASGVYLWIVKSPDGVKSGKLIVIR